MTNCAASSLHEYPSLQQGASGSTASYTLTWRQGKLLVGAARQSQHPSLPALSSQDRLVACLAHSPAQQVGLDPAMGEADLKLWAEACLQAEKSAFLRLPSNPALPHKQQPLSWWLKCSLDRIVAALLLLLLSPFLLGLGVLLMLHSSEPVLTKEWRVGERGKLFQVFQFRTQPGKREPAPEIAPSFGSAIGLTEDHLLSLKGWMRRYKLNELPQLVNVLQGDMSLVGPRALNLREVAQLEPANRQQLNALPGLTGNWHLDRQRIQLNSRSGLPRLTLEPASQSYVESLYSWSLWKDMQALLLSVSRVFSEIR